MTELEFENKLIEQLSTGIVTNAAKSNQIMNYTLHIKQDSFYMVLMVYPK
ncbi:MAG: hypothetical protein E6246_06880 [Veillonella sp.]|nr:hypothetical protein [Veillonella sp.]